MAILRGLFSNLKLTFFVFVILTICTLLPSHRDRSASFFGMHRAQNDQERSSSAFGKRRYRSVSPREMSQRERSMSFLGEHRGTDVRYHDGTKATYYACIKLPFPYKGQAVFEYRVPVELGKTSVKDLEEILEKKFAAELELGEGNKVALVKLLDVAVSPREKARLWPWVVFSEKNFDFEKVEKSWNAENDSPVFEVNAKGEPIYCTHLFLRKIPASKD